MNSAERHRKAHPSARPSTLRLLEQKDRTTEQLRAEIEAQSRVNAFRDKIHYQPDIRPIDIVVAIAGKLKRLAMTGRA